MGPVSRAAQRSPRNRWNLRAAWEAAGGRSQELSRVGNGFGEWEPREDTHALGVWTWTCGHIGFFKGPFRLQRQGGREAGGQYLPFRQLPQTGSPLLSPAFKSDLTWNPNPQIRK